MELGKTFDPKSAEEHWYQRWIDLGYFKADPARPGPVFSIVIPPPNVTGQLHLGHALNVTLHDVIVRTRRMQGYNTLWQPGTDHAGIATQNVVERELAKEGKSRHDLGRDAFVARVWQWRETYGGRILNQLRRLGASCDWSRERFTLDPGLSRAVTEIFVRLYREGLIYRALSLINWCPRCETALSDLEVDHKETPGHLWYIRYPLGDGTGAVTVATTRPETMLGDTAVAVHPDDARYKAMVGKKIMLPLIGREIPIISDPAVDPAFGTGAVKITPGHDFNDFQIGRRHNLPQISVMDTHGRMNDEAGSYRGMTREECRSKVVEDLAALGLLEKMEPHQHAIGVCSRCETVVEPMLSYQWFVRVKPLADEAIAAVRDGRTTFHPKRWENTYFSWMENVYDWCISRQLWWGHRIPAYWCERCGEMMVAAERPAACIKCGGSDLRQEEDVLDTWFSSALWPFSTLGWPDQTPELARYYPTSLLITGFDIIFFWVARMMMMGLKCTGEVPFRDVYITPLVRDQFGKKMTKSRGNVVDPLQIMETYGTDAVRFTLAQLSVQGRDLILSDDRLAASRAFANKVWNAARFVLMNLEGAPQPLPPAESRRISHLPSDGSSRRWTMRSRKSAPRSIATSSTSPRCGPTALSGTSSVTGISSSPRSRSSRAASGRPRCVGCWCDASTGCSDCSIRSCPSSPKKSGKRCGRISASRGWRRIWRSRNFRYRKRIARLALTKRRRWSDVSLRPRRSIHCARCSVTIRDSGSKRRSSFSGPTAPWRSSARNSSDGSPTPRPWPRRQASDWPGRRTTRRAGW